MKTGLLYTLLFFLLVSLGYSCKKDDKLTGPTISADTLALNKWIYQNMKDSYLWTDSIPANIDNTKEQDPEAYFYKLLYTPKDHWSWITSDYASLAAEFSGTQSTMGYSPAFYKLNDGSIIIVVEYVYPGSAAEQAGLKRGDIILNINNTFMTTSNYYDLYSGSSYSVQLGAISNNALSFTGTSIDLTAKSTVTDPAIYHKIFEVNGKKIGYLVYVSFVSGDNDIFLTSLNNIFTEFKTAGISDLIVDLRYNPGGEISAAQYLASEIAPYSVVTGNNVLITTQYNKEIQAYYQGNSLYADQLTRKFVTNVTNVNMQKVYFLTTSGTASASELVISSLFPYMNVVRIGESTYGKYTGMWVIPDDNEKWAMLPVVLKYSNSQGFTDFENGLTPDYEIQDDLFSAVPFGDISDPMVVKAISLITGTSAKSAKSGVSIPHERIVPDKFLLKRNLIVPSVAAGLTMHK